MKIQPQATDEMTHLADKLASHGVAMLTLMNAEGSLLSRPMTPLEIDEQGVVWMFVSRRALADSVGRERVCANLSFCDERRASFVSIAGQAALANDPERAAALWTPMARPWFPSGKADPDLALLWLAPEKVEYWEGPDSVVVRRLALAASVIAGKPIGLGAHAEFYALPLLRERSICC